VSSSADYDRPEPPGVGPFGQVHPDGAAKAEVIGGRALPLRYSVAQVGRVGQDIMSTAMASSGHLRRPLRHWPCRCPQVENRFSLGWPAQRQRILIWGLGVITTSLSDVPRVAPT
jgi:hypothetical protein